MKYLASNKVIAKFTYILEIIVQLLAVLSLVYKRNLIRPNPT